jgi:O-antigen biosynthesis protein WbqP
VSHHRRPTESQADLSGRKTIGLLQLEPGRGSATRTAERGQNAKMKRLFDLTLATLLLAPAAALVALMAVLIKLDSPGPALFAQPRVGRHGSLFTCLKLRTMNVGAPVLPTHESSVSAVTRTGRFLRATKLDELPQLWNILKGDMSFVGPRPCLPMQTELIEARRRLGVLDLLPGVTGVAQVRGIDMSDAWKLAETDAAYLGGWSVWRDVRILARTVLGAGRGDRTGNV